MRPGRRRRGARRRGRGPARPPRSGTDKVIRQLEAPAQPPPLRRAGRAARRRSGRPARAGPHRRLRRGRPRLRPEAPGELQRELRVRARLMFSGRKRVEATGIDAGSRSASSAPASAASGWGSASRRRASTSSRSSSAARRVGGVWRANTYPGRRLRRPLAPLLVLVRAGPRLVAPLRAAGRDPALPRGLRRRASGSARTSASAPRWRRPTSTRLPARWTLRPTDGESHAFDVLVTACGQLTPPDDARDPGPRGVRGPRLPLGRVGPRGRPRRQAGRGDRHRRQRDPVRPRDRARRRAARRSTSARRPGSCRKPTAPTREWERRLFRRFPAARRRQPARHLRASRGRHLRLHRAPLGAAPLRGGRRPLPPRRAAATPSCGRKATPDYPIGCKRVLITNDWYPTLARPDVELVDGPVERITPSGVVGADGVERAGRRDRLRHRLPARTTSSPRWRSAGSTGAT